MTVPGGGGGGGTVRWRRAVDLVTAQAIVTSWTQQINLGVVGLNMGEARFYVPNSVISTKRKRIGGIIYFTDDIDDGFCLYGEYHTEAVEEYPGGSTTTMYWREQLGNRYDIEGYLTVNHIIALGLELTSAVLSGQNLELVWTGTGTLDITIEARATHI